MSWSKTWHSAADFFFPSLPPHTKATPPTKEPKAAEAILQYGQKVKIKNLGRGNRDFFLKKSYLFAWETVRRGGIVQCRRIRPPSRCPSQSGTRHYLLFTIVLFSNKKKINTWNISVDVGSGLPAHFQPVATRTVITFKEGSGNMRFPYVKIKKA